MKHRDLITVRNGDVFDVAFFFGEVRALLKFLDAFRNSLIALFVVKRQSLFPLGIFRIFHIKF